MSQRPPQLPPRRQSDRPSIQAVGQGGNVGESDQSHDDRRRLAMIVIAILLLLLFLLFLFLSSVYVAGMGNAGRGKSGTGQASAGDRNGLSGRGQADEPVADSQDPGAGKSPSVDPPTDQTPVANAKEATPLPNANPSNPSDTPGTTGQQGTEIPPPEAITTTPEEIEEPQSGGATFTIPGSDFFGIKSRGNEFVYVIDCSGSMRGQPFLRAKQELKKSIDNLSDTQSFSVIFFSNENFPMYFPNPSPGLILGSEKNKTQVAQWIDAFKTRGSTDPEESLLEALGYNPDVIYLLTDGSFNTDIVGKVSNANTNEVSINTIGFSKSAQEKNLKEIAQRNNGNYRKVE